ncbi:MAG: flagellar export protein FliJ [Myxococcota bacterium]|nr:flagellar export protein FliJ [Myxococcota bacterium]
MGHDPLPLLSLLDLKRRVTDEHRVALMQKRAALSEAEARLVELYAELAELQSQLVDLLRQARVISPTQMLLGDSRRQAVLECIEVQRAEVHEAEEQVFRSRLALLEARRDEASVELLRERLLHRHLHPPHPGRIVHIDGGSAPCRPSKQSRSHA